MSDRQDELDRYQRNIDNPPRPRDLDPDYVRHYNRGWKASSNPNAIAPLDAADRRGEPDAWYDGYSDYGCNRPKWTRTPDNTGPGDVRPEPKEQPIDRRTP